jgi:two-component system invasion response regulator UvrY
MLKLLIIDDHPIVRRGLKQILSEASISLKIDESSHGDAALEKINNDLYDIVLLDISMPGRSGLELLKQIKSIKPELDVLILSIHPEEHYGPLVFRLGASGYVSKSSAPEELIKAIQKVVKGGKYVSSSLAEKLVYELDKKNPQNPHSELSTRELQVMIKIAAGKTLTDISKELFLSKKTISTYRTRILKKMRMKNNAQIIHYALKHKLVD